ncbi:MAG: phosphoenolpyruvate-protein phosphotransferase system enzyme [Acidobacteriota bacterium]|nr:phosphoenolpyruvate-protein phosphotransferase system enzyme [Acidobacteriota bacterium]
MSKRRRKTEQEERWRGRGVSEGVALGRVLRVFNGTRQVYRATLDEKDIGREVRRLRAAIRLARRQLLAIKARAEKELGADHAYIFDAHLLMLEDRKLLDDVEKYISEERANAEWAVKVAADRLLAVYAEIKDDYLRERGSDIEDVTQRILVALSGEGLDYRKLTEDAIIVAEDLLPSAVAELDFEHARAIATDAGGWTSHTAIIARGLRIPAVVGLRDLHRRAQTGDQVVVDAQQGIVILHPSAETVKHYKALITNSSGVRHLPASEDGRGPLLMLDGKEITLRANVELPAEYEDVRRYGARGIGLYRSEFLLSHKGAMPSEEEQCEAYREVAELAGEDGATIRLFDLGGEKFGGATTETERNPALGLRAIRFSLRQEEVLRTQARAILRAAAYGHLDIVLPMVSDVTDVRRAKRLINEERARLDSEGKKSGRVKIGAMIEVPSAVMTADKVAREVDFFSLGTNDLVQYLLAVDRGNEDVADWFRSLHPAVLQSIERTLDAARKALIPAVVCGEMASTPAYVVVLIGLGATDLSMTPSSIPRVRRTIAGIKHADAQEIALACLECETADDVEELVRVRLSKNWPHLFPPKSLPAPRDAE